MKREKVKVSKLQENPDNPRLLRADKKKKLEKSIKEFPEMLSARPIVVNQDYTILGGNMRYKALLATGAKEVEVMVVDWSEEKQREFIIKDNVGFGEWDWDLLHEWNEDELVEWGMDLPDIIDQVDKVEDGEEIEIPQSVQLEPPMEYILVMAEPNSIEWEELKEQLQLKMVRRGGYKKGSAFDAVSLERVLTWTELKTRIDAHSSTK